MGSGNWQLPMKVEVTCVAQVEGACCGTNMPEENAAQRAGADVRARGLLCGGGGESVEGAEDREEEEEGSRGAEKAECEECRDRWWEDDGAGGFGAGAEQAEVRSRAALSGCICGVLDRDSECAALRLAAVVGTRNVWVAVLRRCPRLLKLL
jgi:hypothetical protein